MSDWGGNINRIWWVFCGARNDMGSINSRDRVLLRTEGFGIQKLGNWCFHTKPWKCHALTWRSNCIYEKYIPKQTTIFQIARIWKIDFLLTDSGMMKEEDMIEKRGVEFNKWKRYIYKHTHKRTSGKQVFLEQHFNECESWAISSEYIKKFGASRDMVLQAVLQLRDVDDKQPRNRPVVDSAVNGTRIMVTDAMITEIEVLLKMKGSLRRAVLNTKLNNLS